jgi:hypothetical protein
MRFVLLGFEQSNSIRQFRFESVGADHRRTPVVVTADLMLAREYDIQVQNLPLLCWELLIRSEPGILAAGLVSLTATDMAALRMAAQARSEEKKPRRVRPVISNNVGKAWRGAPM